MVEKCPQYGALPSPGVQYNACYKHVHSMPLSLSTTPPATASLAPSPGLGLMAAPNAPKFGTVIPSRIFVGGIDFKTSEEDLQKFFSAFGSVRDTKIIRDRAEVSKGYGFVTFSSTEEVNKVMDQEECLYLNGKKLNIGPAIRKQQVYLPKEFHVPPPCSWVMHPGGYASYTNTNGITYFLPTTQVLPPQMVPTQQPYVMAYNGTTAQPIAQYGGYGQSPGTLQPIPSNLGLPWSPTQTGSCGQIITPVQTLDPGQAISMVPMASSNTAGTVAQAPRTTIPGTNQAAPIVAAPPHQAHIQVPTTYVCSPLPGQHQSLPMRIAPNSAPQMIQTATEHGQPIMHSIHYGQQMSTVNSKGHPQIAPATGEVPTIALPDPTMMPAYGIQPAVYPATGLVGVQDVNAPVQYAPIPHHQGNEVLTPPPTPETQPQTK